MPYQLVYLPKSGNKNYWTIDHSFTHKMKNHCFWDDSAQLIADLPTLKAQYPTIFNNRRDDRFYLYDEDDKPVANVMEMMIAPTADTFQTTGQPSAIPIIAHGSKEYYAIRADIDKQQYYYDSSKGKNGSFVTLGAGEIRFWKRQELDKAIATAQNLCRNKNFLKKLPGLTPKNLIVVNIRTNESVWSAQSMEAENANQTSPTDELLAKVKAQLDEHFDWSDRGEILNDQGEQLKMPTVDLEHYSAPQVFAALCYVIEALNQRATVNSLLDVYDQFILQDYLHTVELTDAHQLDSAAFIESLQKMRQERRKVKDLSVLLNAIGDNIDQTTILKQLLGHQSLHNQYHYRHHQLGDQLLKMIDSPDVEDEED